MNKTKDSCVINANLFQLILFMRSRQKVMSQSKNKPVISCRLKIELDKPVIQ